MITHVGALTDRIAITTRDGSPLRSIWARVRSISARLAATGDATHSVTTRFRTDVGVGSEIIYRGRRMKVVSAEDLNGRRAWLSMRAIEASTLTNTNGAK